MLLLSPYVYADTKDLSSANDSLYQLTKTLPSGSYSHPDDMDIPTSSEIKVSVGEKVNEPILSNASIEAKYGNNYASTYSAQASQPQWKTYCDTDRFDGTKTCFMTYKHIAVGIYNGVSIIFINGNSYPRSKSAFKVDNSPTIYGVEDGIYSASKLIQQMKRGRTLYTRYYSWPNQSKVDQEIDLIGFTSAFEYMMSAYRRL